MRSFYKDKKVLITGNTGFKGSWLTLYLEYLGAEVSGYALAPPTTPSLFELADLRSRVHFQEGDVRDRELLQSFVKDVAPDMIIHMAAQPLVRDSYKIPHETYEINVMGTVNILEAVRQAPSVKALVNVTTDKCYDNREWVWGYRENEALGGYDPYSSSKACSELVTASYRSSYFPQEKIAEHGVGVATARAGNVIGGGDWATDRILTDCVQGMLGGEEIFLRNPGAIRPWQFVLEPLHGYLLLLQRLYNGEADCCEAFNFGPDNRGTITVKELVQSLCEKWGDTVSCSHAEENGPHEAHYLKLDCSKAEMKLQWKAIWSLDQALDAIVEWTKVYEAEASIYDISMNQISNFEKRRLEINHETR